MKISGLQKLSLVDYDGKIATTLFVSGCNFACPFCHNKGLVAGSEPEIFIDDIFEFLAKRRAIIEGVVVSGGEPTIYPDLPEFITKIKNMGYFVKLDTNGTNPEMLGKLIESGVLDAIAMDVKNSPEKYALTTNSRINTDDINASIQLIMASNLDYEFRTTLVKEYHNSQSIQAIAKWIKGANKYYLQKFVDNPNCISRNLNSIDKETADKYLADIKEHIPNATLRGY